MKSSGISPPHQAVQLRPRRPGDLIRSARTNWEAHWIAVASLTVLCLALAAACARHTSQSPSTDSQKRPVVQTGHSSTVRSVAFSPDGKTLASGSLDNTVKLWDVSTGTELRTLEGHSAEVLSVAFSPDGKTLASGSRKGTIKLWDVSTGTELRTLTPMAKYLIRTRPGASDENGFAAVFSVAFSPDGKTLASGSEDNTVKLWDVSTGAELRTLTGHSESVESVAFSTNGKILVSGSLDKTVKLWDVSTGTEVRTLRHSDFVRSVAFSPDGKILASGSDDETVKLWNVSTG